MLDWRRMDRVPEPELMDRDDQADAYAAADFTEVNDGFVDRVVQTVGDRPHETVVDLGCGPADILIRLAKRWPTMHAVGVDGADAMLRRGVAAVAEAGLDDRIRLHLSRVPGADVPSHTFDVVISNSLLHHLHAPEGLWKEVRRLGKPGATVVIMDLKRPATTSEAERIVETYAANERPILKIDFFNSLRAAFRPREVHRQLAQAGLTQLDVAEVSDRHLLVSGRLPENVTA